MIKLDEKSKEILIARLAGDAGEANEHMYVFATHLYTYMKDVDWKGSEDSKGNKITQTSILEELASKPNMPSADAGALRQMKKAGEFIHEVYGGDISEVSQIGYWTFHNIARAKLVKDDYELDIKEKKNLIAEVIEGKVKPGKVKSQIKKIKLLHAPGELKDLLQVYNQWSFASPDPRFGDDWPGRIPGQIVLNVIYHYFDKYKPIKILDPMSGGGSTHDVCKYLSNLDTFKMINKTQEDKEKEYKLREVGVESYESESENYTIEFNGFDIDSKSINGTYDKITIIETDGIAALDVDITETPRNITEKDAVKDEWNIDDLDLVFMDPPYFNQVGEKYIDNPFTESRSSFFSAMQTIINKAHNALKTDGMLAIIISPQTEKSIDFKGGEVCFDMPFEIMKMMENSGFKHFNRIQVPLGTEQFGPQDVDRAKKYEERHRLLGTARDLILMKKK